MSSKKNSILAMITYFLATIATAKINVVTTTTNARALITEIGGQHVEVTSLTKGGQDPHHIDAKPSFMVRLAKTDLLVSVGLGLEEGWLPAVIRGSRKTSLKEGRKRSLVLGNNITPLDRIFGNVSREHGDVHPEGNPHFMLSPSKAAGLASVVATKLSELDPKNSSYYFDRATQFEKKMNNALKHWKSLSAKSSTSNVITYHQTLRYFFADLGFKSIAQIEPKPGIPPTSSHMLYLKQLIKNRNIETILIENYYSDKTAQKLIEGNKKTSVQLIPVAVDGEPHITNLFQLYERIVQAINKRK